MLNIEIRFQDIMKKLKISEIISYMDMDNKNTGMYFEGKNIDCPEDVGLKRGECNLDCRFCWVESIERLKQESTTKAQFDNKRLILLVGESASGKSTIEKMLVETGNFNKAVSHTTRPIREGEQDGVDYHYISEVEFNDKLKNGDFVEHTIYNNWRYGVDRNEITNSNNAVVLVVNPHGFRMIDKLNEFDVTSFYIKSDWQTRLKRIVDRGDDLMEIMRRMLSDQGVFQGIADELDFTIENNSYGEYKQDESLARTVEDIFEYLAR